MILDIVIIGFVLIGAFLGYKKGLVGIAMSLISIILSLVLGFMFSGMISDGLYNDTGIGKSIEQIVYDGLNSSINEEETQENTDNIYENIVNTVIGNAKEALTLEQAAKVVTMFILKGLSFVIIFIVVYIICYILRMVLNIVFDLPILHSVNKFGGIAAGLIQALLKIYVLLAIVSFLAPVPVIEPVISYINNSTITKLLYNNNLLVYLITTGIKI